MKATLIVLGVLAFQFVVFVFMGKLIRAGHDRRCSDPEPQSPGASVRPLLPQYYTHRLG